MAIVFFVGVVICFFVYCNNLSETDDENEKNLSESDDENKKKSCCFGCALILIISFLLVCFKVFGFLSGISFDPSDLIPEIRNPFHWSLRSL